MNTSAAEVAAPRVTHQPGESRTDFIRRLVDAAPPLSERQRARLRPVLAPMREPKRLAS